MNRRRQLDDLHQPIIDIYGNDLGQAIIGLLDILAVGEDERDDLIAGAIRIDGNDPGRIFTREQP